MTYSFQDFVNLNVATETNLDQIEINIRDHIHGQSGVSSMPRWKDAAEYSSLSAAITAIGATPTTLLIATSINDSNSVEVVTVPATLALLPFRPGVINKGSATSLTINGPVVGNPMHQWLSGFGVSDVTFGAGSVNEVMVRWWGFSSSSSDVVNGTAIQSAINSNAPEISLPNGIYSYNVALTIDRAIQFHGTGSSGADNNSTGAPGASTTKLTYSGTGIGLTLVGSGIEGKENIHLRDFSLWGNSSAIGGLLIGSTGLITKSSIKNCHIREFTNTNAYGLRMQNALETLLENVYTQSNYDGIVNLAGDTATTIRFQNVTSRTNARYGTYLKGNFSGVSIESLINEGNHYSGLCIEGSGVHGIDFYSYYSEANNQTGGTAPIEIGITGSTAPYDITFFGGLINDAVGNVSFNLNRAVNIALYKPRMPTINAGFITVTANTIECAYYGDGFSTIPEDNIVGNTGQAIIMPRSKTTKLISLTYDTGSASGVQNFTGVGFKATHAEIIAAIPSTGETSKGFDTGTNAYCIYSNPDGQGGGLYATNLTSSIILAQGVGISCVGNISSWNYNGGVISWTKNGAKTGIANIFLLLHR